MQNLLRYLRDFFFFLFILYFAQGALYSQGSMVSQGALVLILVFSLFSLWKVLLLNNKKDLFFKAWTALLLLNVIGFVFTADFGRETHMNMFKGVLLNSLPFYFTFYLSRKGILKAKHLQWFLIIMLPVTALRFQYNETRVLMEQVAGKTDVVNNVAYSFVSLIPFVFLLKGKRIFSIAIMLFLFYYIIIGAKRGAMISGAIGLGCYMYYQIRTVDGKNKWKGYLLAIIGIAFLSYFAVITYQNNPYLVSRMDGMLDEGGSGRDRIYSSIFDGWASNTNILVTLFGYGFAASLDLSSTGHFAHNDWLELLSNFGILGVSIYFILFISSIKYIRSNFWNNDKKIVILTVVLLWFFATLVSMSYSNTTGGLQAIILGYLIGHQKKNID